VKCSSHQDIDAVGICVKCTSAVCRRCGFDGGKGWLCQYSCDKSQRPFQLSELESPGMTLLGLCGIRIVRPAIVLSVLGLIVVLLIPSISGWSLAVICTMILSTIGILFALLPECRRLELRAKHQFAENPDEADSSDMA
jgi:hypothetical protein